MPGHLPFQNVPVDEDTTLPASVIYLIIVCSGIAFCTLCCLFVKFIEDKCIPAREGDTERQDGSCQKEEITDQHKPHKNSNFQILRHQTMLGQKKGCSKSCTEKLLTEALPLYSDRKSDEKSEDMQEILLNYDIKQTLK